MKRLGILHISDAHVQKKDETEIREIIQKLIADVKSVQEQKGINIDLICFTGDLIQQGDKAIKGENQWNLGKEILVDPLLKEIGLSSDRFIFVPGNHEVNIDGIVPRLEKGLQISSLQEINDILKDFDDSYKERLSYFYTIVKENGNDVIFGTLGYSYKKQINGLNVGIVCVDSAWRSSGKGDVERGKIYVGAYQIQKLYINIKHCDVKICMMHHPIDWLENCERLEVEKELSNFDIVLRGHVHEEDLKQVIRKNMKTVYSTAGKLYPLDYANGRAIDGYNGYSILDIEFATGKCSSYIRSYYGTNRNEFDVGVNICPNGEESYDIFANEDNHRFEFDIITGINKYFHEMSEKYALIKDTDSKSPKNYLQVIVEPVLSVRSEYVKEQDDNEDSEEINIQGIVASDKNILLIGKKESGKTTILQQIGIEYLDDYEFRGIIPIYINMNYLPKGNERVLNCAMHFIQENIDEQVSLSKQKIKEILKEGNVVFLLDNVNTKDSDHTIWIYKFINEYGKNRFILTIEEEFFQSLDIKEIPDYGTEFKEIYIQYMGKRQIRAMVTKWAKGKEGDLNIDETVDRIDSYCNQINFAKTPFNIAVFMVIWDIDNNFIPVNEGIVMRNYLEIVLEKLSPKEAYRSTYSFTLKENFLSYIAHEMYLKDKYYFTHEEFRNTVVKYHQKKGYILSDSKFDTIFFEKNILSYMENVIVFSHTSFLEYFLALYALNNNEFLDEITSEGKRVSFKNEICFYAGLNQDCTKILDNLSDVILDTVIEYIDLIEDLNDLEIVTEFKIEKEKFIEEIQKNRPSLDELDAASDKSVKFCDKNPTELRKADVSEGEADNLFSLLHMYGSVIKNAELLDNNLKILHLENYMYGMNMLYAMLISLFEYIKDDMDFDKLEEQDKKLLKVNTKEEFEQMKAQMVDITKLLFPIAIQNMILENVGTPKLESAIDELIKNKQDKPFEKFMLAFLKCDLKIVNLRKLLGKYIKEESSSGILKIMLMKLTSYYRNRFFGNNRKIDRDLIDLITEIQMKLNPQKHQNFYKSKIAKHTKDRLDQNLK